MRHLFAAAPLVLALAACTQAEEPAAPPAPPEPAPVLGGVDLAQPVRALGTEPFWSVELTGTEMADGVELRVTLVATECSDGMSDRTYPLTAMVKVGEQELAGCAAASAAIMSSGESGPVV